MKTLADPCQPCGTDIYAVTGGNPFHVTEFLATERATIPHSVRDATLARTARLTSHARRTLDCASIFPRIIDQSLLRQLADDSEHTGVEECMRAGMLNASGEALSFRHELARRAVHEAMAPLRRRELHATALQLLHSRGGVRAAELAHHAQQAGAINDLVLYSQRAAEEAEALGARRESMAHLARVLEHGTWLTQRRACRCAAAAGRRQASSVARLSRRALLSTRRSRRASVPATSPDWATRCAFLRASAGCAAISEVADAQSAEALEVLHDHRETWQYAMALSSQSQLDMLADRSHLAVEDARAGYGTRRASAVAGTSTCMRGPTLPRHARRYDVERGIPEFLAAIAETKRRGELDLLPRLYANLTYMMTYDRHYQDLFTYLEEGIAAAVARDNAPLEAYIRGTRALALLDLGRTAEALTEAEGVVYGPYPRGTGRFNAHLALARSPHPLWACQRTVFSMRRVPCPLRGATSCAAHRSPSSMPKRCGSGCRARGRLSGCATHSTCARGCRHRPGT